MSALIYRCSKGLISRTVAGLAVICLLMATTVSAAPAPGRPTFDWQKDQIGATGGPVFNSYIRTPHYGDERTFFDAARSDQVKGHDTGFSDVVAAVTGGNRQLILRIYVHNDANQGLNGNGADGKGVARDTTVRVKLPSDTGKQLQSTAYISAGNASPAEVSDIVQFTDRAAFSIQYIPGSAVLYNAAHPKGMSLPDAIVSSGARIGYQNMDGTLPGGFNYQAVITLKAKVVAVGTSSSSSSASGSSSSTGRQPPPLSNTGPGSSVALFLVASATGAIGYRMYLGRRVSRQD